MAEQDTERLRKQKKLSLVLDLITPGARDQRCAGPSPFESSRRADFGLAHARRTESATAKLVHATFCQARPYVKEFWNTLLPKLEIGVYHNGDAGLHGTDLWRFARHMVVPNAIRSTWNNFDSEWHTLSLEVRREAQSRTPLLRRRAAEDTATETDASGGTTETEAETVAVPFP
jgi:hypothetical protein